MTKQIIRIGAAVMTTLLALFLLWQFRIVVVYALVSLALAATLRPLVARLAGHDSWCAPAGSCSIWRCWAVLATCSF